jgi:hypothetical protein
LIKASLKKMENEKTKVGYLQLRAFNFHLFAFIIQVICICILNLLSGRQAPKYNICNKQIVFFEFYLLFQNIR